jgi:hypothetical protein
MEGLRLFSDFSGLRPSPADETPSASSAQQKVVEGDTVFIDDLAELVNATFESFVPFRSNTCQSRNGNKLFGTGEEVNSLSIGLFT